jgi:hypothetical protein
MSRLRSIPEELDDYVPSQDWVEHKMVQLMQTIRARSQKSAYFNSLSKEKLTKIGKRGTRSMYRELVDLDDSIVQLQQWLKHPAIRPMVKKSQNKNIHLQSAFIESLQYRPDYTFENLTLSRATQ